MPKRYTPRKRPKATERGMGGARDYKARRAREGAKAHDPKRKIPWQQWGG